MKSSAARRRLSSAQSGWRLHTAGEIRSPEPNSWCCRSIWFEDQLQVLR